MPFNGTYKYTPLNDWIAQQANADWSGKTADWANYGMDTTSPYAGLDNSAIASKFTNGADPSAWFNDYITKNAGTNANRFSLANGQVRQENYTDPGDAEGLGVMALAGGGLFGMAGAAGLLGGGAADVGGAGTGLEAGGGVGVYGDPAMFTPGAGADLTTAYGGTAAGAGAGGLGGTGVSGTQAASTAQSILSKIAGGTATSDDWLKLLGQVGPSVLGAFGANSQSNALGALADKFAGYGAPYRDQLSALMANPSSFYSSPEASGAFDAMARKLSIGGNPAGDPYKQATLTGGLYSLLQGKENQLAGFGGLTAYNAAAPGAATTAAGTGSNIYNAVGAGLGNVLNPPTDLQTLLAQLKGSGVNFGAGSYGLS